MVICKRCQSENGVDTRFCSFCGGRLPARVEPLGAAAKALDPDIPSQTSTGRTATGHESDGERRYVQKVVYQHFMRAKELIRGRNFDAAIAEFKQALEVKPGEPTITQMLVKTLAAQKLAQAAKGSATPVIPFQPAAIPRRPAAAPVSTHLASEALRQTVRPPGRASSKWLQSLQGSGMSPSVALDAATSGNLPEIAVTLMILGGLAMFALILTM